MSAQPIEQSHRAMIPREAAAVLAALPATTAADFRAALASILDEAKRTLDIDGLKPKLDTVVGRYWAVACAVHSPDAAAITEAGRRWQAGDDSDTVPATVVFGKLR
jgi:Family of unknown function (DUF6247)